MTGMVAAAASRASAFRDAWRRPHEARSVNQRVMISSVLATAEFGVEGVTRLASTIILTRILAPEDFGAYAVVLFTLYLLTMVTDLGIRSIVFTREGGLTDDFLRTCWTVQLIRGLVIAVAVVLIGLALGGVQAAGVVDPASSYADPALPWVICGASLALMIKSAESPNPFLYERDMRFVRVTFSRIGAGVLGAVVTVALVWAIESIWALLFGQIVAMALHTAVSFLLFRGPAMALRLEREARRVIWARGKWIMSHSGLTAVTELADRVMFSVFLSAGDFGFYYIARQIFMLFHSVFEKVNASFSLQYFTYLFEAHAPAGISREYYRYRLWLDTFSGLTAGGLFALAPLIVAVIYDDRYATVGVFLQVLALGLPLVGAGFIRSAFSAQRRFRAMALLSVIQTAAIWVGLLVALAVFGSTLGAVLVVALHRLPELAVLLWKGRREGWVRLRHELRVVPLFAIGAGLGWAVALAARGMGVG